MPCKTLAIIFHSGMGHTSYQAKAVRDGASRVDGVDVKLIYVEDAREQWKKSQRSTA